jgi:hypothetical protein
MIHDHEAFPQLKFNNGLAMEFQIHFSVKSQWASDGKNGPTCENH